MKVFKFGGASIKNADAIRNMASIIKQHAHNKLVVVVSAMGKTTNALEQALNVFRKEGKLTVDEIMNYHKAICIELFDPTDPIFQELDYLESVLAAQLKQVSQDYTEHYDQVVSLGEIISSKIIYRYLAHSGLPISWVDSRQIIITNSNFRNGIVDWDETNQNIQALKQELEHSLVITQGFIGGNRDHKTTTLGREGSDYSAAIYATCLKAESMTVWKDVPGILNADPKKIEDAKLFTEIPYKEAAEMTYYGASVIHPKTIKPLANNNIPLFVRSFDNPLEQGTIIHDCDRAEHIPAIILKENQCLVSFNVVDYTFVNEENLGLIFNELARLDIKINIMQNSAISFSIVIDYIENKLSDLIKDLSPHFEIRYNTGLTLITIKNYLPETIKKYRAGKKMLLEQTSRSNYRALYAD